MARISDNVAQQLAERASESVEVGQHIPKSLLTWATSPGIGRLRSKIDQVPRACRGRPKCARFTLELAYVARN